MKFNLSSIMKAAWKKFKMWQGDTCRYAENFNTFGKCLHIAWLEAKSAVEKAEREAKEAAEKAEHIEWMRKNNVVRMHYSEYKDSYSENRTVDGSYDKSTKTIEVYIEEKKREFHMFTGRGSRRKCWF